MKKVQAGGIIRTSLDNTWQTPESVLEPARAYFGGAIPFDAASAPDNPTKARRYCAGAPGTLFAPKADAELTAEEALARRNGLEVAWDWPTWCNPPYGGELRDWLGKIALEAQRGTEVVALLPASRWETSYLPRLLSCVRVVCFHRGRIAFVSSLDGKPVAGNPGASMILGLNVDVPRFVTAFAPLGSCFELRALAGGAA